MPRQALGESEYFAGALASKIDDNEDATAPLRNSEELRVQNRPGNVQRPEFGQFPEHHCEISSSVGTEDSRHIFENKESWTSATSRLPHLAHDPYALEE